MIRSTSGVGNESVGGCGVCRCTHLPVAALAPLQDTTTACTCSCYSKSSKKRAFHTHTACMHTFASCGDLPPAAHSPCARRRPVILYEGQPGTLTSHFSMCEAYMWFQHFDFGISNT